MHQLEEESTLCTCSTAVPCPKQINEDLCNNVLLRYIFILQYILCVNDFITSFPVGDRTKATATPVVKAARDEISK